MVTSVLTIKELKCYEMCHDKVQHSRYFPSERSYISTCVRTAHMEMALVNGATMGDDCRSRYFLIELDDAAVAHVTNTKKNQKTSSIFVAIKGEQFDSIWSHTVELLKIHQNPHQFTFRINLSARKFINLDSHWFSLIKMDPKQSSSFNWRLFVRTWNLLKNSKEMVQFNGDSFLFQLAGRACMLPIENKSIHARRITSVRVGICREIFIFCTRQIINSLSLVILHILCDLFISPMTIHLSDLGHPLSKIGTLHFL